MIESCIIIVFVGKCKTTHCAGKNKNKIIDYIVLKTDQLEDLIKDISNDLFKYAQ